MKTIFTILSLSLLLAACQKKDHVCVCNGTSLFGGNYTKSYVIHDTERKARKQCEKTDRNPNQINLFAPDCSLH